MMSDAVRGYLERPEGQLFDRKSGRIAPRDLAVHLIAFANADGGTLVLGIENDGRITGMEQHVARANQLIQAGFDFCEPSIRVEHTWLPCTNVDGAADRLLVLTVEPSDRVHAQTNGDAFVRVGDQSRKLGFEERLELHYDKGESRYDAEVARDATWDDLDGELLERYWSVLGIRGSLEDAFVARGLAKRRDGKLAITNAGILLFGIQPVHWFPRAEIRILRYDGTRRETGPRMNVVKDIIVEGPLPRLLPEAFRAIESQLRGFMRLAPDGTFRTTPEYPEPVWQEAVVNAVVHRSYSLYGIRVEIFIFDDRLEVISPGKLPGRVRVDNIREEHFSRNPRIVRVLTDLGLVGDVGEGVNRMYEGMAGADLPPPEFEDRAQTVRVTLRRARVPDTTPEPEPTDEPTRRVVHLPGNLAQTLNERQVAVLRLLRGQDRITTTDVMRLFPDVSDRTASRDLNELVKLRLLRRVGRTFGTYYHSDNTSYLLPSELEP